MKFVDDAHVLAAHEDGTLALWEVGKRRRTARFVVPKQPVSVMQCADAWPDGAACRVVDLCLLPAHVNKVLVACAPSEGDAGNAGALQLFNYRTSKRLYVFGGVEAQLDASDALSCLCAAPVLDVVAVGTRRGRVIMHNFVLDRTATVIEGAAGDDDADAHDDATVSHPAAVTCLAFRTRADAHAAADLLAVGGANGHIFIWKLGRPCTMHASILHAHPVYASLASLRRSAAARREATRERALAGGVAPSANRAASEDVPENPGVVSLHFFAGEPRLQSSGGDNAIRQYVLDPAPVATSAADEDGGAPTATALAADGMPRLLRARGGPALPLTCVSFYDSQKVLVASNDRSFRILHIRNDSFARELSQGRMETKANRMQGAVSPMDLKLPPVVAADTCELTALEWENVVTVHARTAGEGANAAWSAAHNEAAAAYTWRTSRAAMGRHILSPTEPAERRQLRAMAAGTSAEEAANLDAPAAGGGRKTKARIQPSAVPASGWGSQAGLPPVTCACVTGDGHSTVVGDAFGFVRAYNLQSGRALRAYFEKKGDDKPTRGNKGPALPLPAHAGEVAGVASDPANRWVVSAGAEDGRLAKWTIDGKLTCAWEGEAEEGGAPPIVKIAHHRLGGLLAVACVDGSVRVHESDRLKVCRRFTVSSPPAQDTEAAEETTTTPARRTSKRTKRAAPVTPAAASVRAPPPPRVTALVFAPDGRWLFCGTSDGVLSIFDVPSGTVRQRSRILGAAVPPLTTPEPAPIVSMSASPDGGMLATAHEGYRGVFLWSLATTLAGGSRRHTRVDTVTLASVPTSDVAVGDDGCVVELEDDAEEEEALDDAADAALTAAASSGGGVKGMVSLSRLPRQQLRMLLFGEEIRARLAPVAPPKKPDDAPFFLPSSLVANTHGGRVEVPGGESGGGGEMPGWGDEEDEGRGEDGNGDDAVVAPKEKKRGGDQRVLRAGLDVETRGVWAELARVAAAQAKAAAASAKKRKKDGDAVPADCDYAAVLAYAESVGAAALDAELRSAPLGPGVAAAAAAAGAAACLGSVDPLDADDEAVLASFLSFVLAVVPTGERFELVQGMLAVFLAEYAPLLERAGSRTKALGRAVSSAVASQYLRLECLLDETRFACEALTTASAL